MAKYRGDCVNIKGGVVRGRRHRPNAQKRRFVHREPHRVGTGALASTPELQKSETLRVVGKIQRRLTTEFPAPTRWMSSP